MGYRALLVDEPETYVVSGDWRAVRELLLGDAELDSLEQVLTVALDDHLDVADQGGFEDDVGKAGLHRGMKVNFRLLQDNRGTLGNIGEKNKDREHLGDAEAYIREKNLGRGLGPLHINAIDVGAFLDWCYTERVDEAQLLEPFGDVLLDCNQVSTVFRPWYISGSSLALHSVAQQAGHGTAPAPL